MHSTMGSNIPHIDYLQLYYYGIGTLILATGVALYLQRSNGVMCQVWRTEAHRVNAERRRWSSRRGGLLDVLRRRQRPQKLHGFRVHDNQGLGARGADRGETDTGFRGLT